MSSRFKKQNESLLHYCTFTCWNWLPLIEITHSYDLIYNWFNIIEEKYRYRIIAYVIMPNHVHVILYNKAALSSLGNTISNGKRFISYEIIKRLDSMNSSPLLICLGNAVSQRERAKGQLHKVFRDSFDARAIWSESFLLQKLEYIHHNPVKGKWNLVDNYTCYEHSSAAFYETGMSAHFIPTHYKDI